MEWLSHPEQQGIAVLIAILQIAFTVVQYPGPIGSKSSSIPVRIAHAIVLLAIGWGVYGVLWALLAFSMRFPPSMVFSPVFFVLGAFTVIGAVTTKSPVIGGFIGGSVPLATISLFFLSINPQMQSTAPPLAWFGIGMMFGGLMGALSGPATIGIIQAVQFQSPLRRIQGAVNKPEGDRFSMAFDVFLSHNSQDKAAVRQLARALQDRGLRVWLDVEQLVPGRPWQEEIEKIIQTTRTAVVVIGKDGLGPWEHPEMRICLSQFIKRRMPVIPVLLPAASAQPELPLFLQELTWVDLHGGLTEDKLKQLEWGITGIKPGQSIRPS